MRKLKLYLDTSVWNFFFADDVQREKDVTKDFFDVIEKEIYEIFISGVVIKEVSDAPEPKRTDLLNLISKYKPVANLRKAELFHGISLEMGYFKKLEIITPMEVSSYESY